MRFIRFLKLFFIFLIFLGVSLVLVLQKGNVSIHINEHAIHMPLSYMLIGLVLFGGVLLLFYQIWSGFWSIPERYQKFLEKKKKSRAQNLMIDGLTSLASQQPLEALSSTKLAEKLLPDHPVVRYIAAHSAQLVGDHERSHALFTKMLSESRTKFIGLRGLATLAKSQNDIQKLCGFLDQALELRHDSPWVIDEWLDAFARLELVIPNQNIEKHNISKQIEKYRWHQYLGLIYGIKSQNIMVSMPLNDAKNTLKKALDYRPELIWAACYLSKIYQNEGSISKAQRILLNTYKAMPHRSLGDAWVDLYPIDDAVERLRHLEKLTKESPNHYESYFLMGIYARNANIWGQTLHYMQQAFELHPTRETSYILQSAQGHLQNLEITHVDPPNLERDFAWVCHKCAHTHDEWQPFCQKCDSLDTIQWDQGAKQSDQHALQSHQKPLNLL